MSFLSPWVLWGLPLVALPILIHLIHKRRQQIVEWGAMQFLFEGANLSRGMQKLRHFLLLLLRTLAVAGLIFGLGRPLAGGWVGKLGGGQPDTVLILLDRSASMSEQVAGGSKAKWEAGVEQIVSALESVQPGSLLLIDSVSMQATAVESVEELAELPVVTGVDSQSDIPGMFELAADHLVANQTGRSEIWICSDGQLGDWQPEDGRWQAIEGKLQGLPAGVRVNALHFSAAVPDNLGVRVLGAELVTEGAGAEEGLELSLDLLVRGAHRGREGVSVAIEVDGARSSVALEGEGPEWRLQGHRFPLARDNPSGDGPTGFGTVGLSPDGRASDNLFYFVFGGEKPPEIVIVSERSEVGQILAVAAESFGDPSQKRVVRSLELEGAIGMDLSSASLLLWEGPLPKGDVALRIGAFLEEGGQVVFMAPDVPDGGEFMGCSWGQRIERSGAGTAEVGHPGSLGFWRKAEGFFRNGDDGTPLDLSDLRILRSTEILGEVTFLAGFEDGQGFLARAPVERGGVSFLASSPALVDSNMAVQGLALVALVQRAFEQATEGQQSRSQQDAGQYRGRRSDVEWIAESNPEGLISERFDRAGVLRDSRGLVALNRPHDEDTQGMLSPDKWTELMPGIPMDLMEGEASGGGLIEEIWKLFLGLLAAALILEALVCLPETTVVKSE